MNNLPAVQPERLTDDDFETIRIHLNAYKEKLCNQQRWKEAEEYQRIIDRFMAFAAAQPERERGRWLPDNNNYFAPYFACSHCHSSYLVDTVMGDPTWNFCPNCGADMRGEKDDP